jgi:amidase
VLEITFGDFDVLLVPSAPGEAPKGLASTGHSIFNSDWTTLHTPAVTVPVFRGPARLPIGAQFVGAYGADYKTLACAEWAFRVLV